jgi:hypothetical protein
VRCDYRSDFLVAQLCSPSLTADVVIFQNTNAPDFIPIRFPYYFGFNSCHGMANLAQRSALAAEAPSLDRSSKENRWYFKELGSHLSPSSRKLLEEYSSIPAKDVESHIYKMVKQPQKTRDLCV